VKKRRCSACGRLFEPCVKVKSQQYCSGRGCQKERKRRWQAKKRAEDPEYRANQRDAQRRWREKHPHYWRDYRKRHSDYEQRNRELQRERNRRNRGKPEPIAKMDALTGKRGIISGDYQLVPLGGGTIAKMDAINVKIQVIPRC
jgi:hypothetical protein